MRRALRAPRAGRAVLCALGANGPIALTAAKEDFHVRVAIAIQWRRRSRSDVADEATARGSIRRGNRVLLCLSEGPTGHLSID
jgi:hypothetical protein